MSADSDQDHMRRAIAVARANFGKTRPNPVVGCVIVRAGVVLAEAATSPGGRPHAEEQALAALDGRAHGSDAFVTLEPCGRRSDGSASCSERLARAGVARVFIAAPNPDPMSAGVGPDRLARAGVEVHGGFLLDEARPLYAGFLHRLETGRPEVTASVDGAGFETLFRPEPGEPLAEALRRYGSEGYVRLWTPLGGEVAQALDEQGLLRALGA